MRNYVSSIKIVSFIIMFLAFTIGSLTSCTHNGNVTTLNSGVHLVVTKGNEPDSAYRNAYAQAEDYCDTTDKHAYVVTEDSQFTGSGTESDHQNNRKLAKVATVGGFMGAITMPITPLRQVAGAAAIGGIVSQVYLGNEYQIRMKFVCDQ